MKDFLFVFFAWVLSLPLLVAVIVFALMNNENVEAHFNPFQEAISVPLYVPVLGAMILGALLGTLMTWAAMGRLRAKVRLQKKQIKILEKQLEVVGQNHTSQTMAPKWLPQTTSLMIGPQ